MHREILEQLHAAHQGAVSTKQQAGLTVHWPGLNNNIENIVSSCSQCQDHLPSNAKEPIIFKAWPVRPFQEAAADLCHHAGRHYLIIIDCYSGWPTIAPMGTDITSSNVISAFRTLFSQKTSVPEVLWSDGGPHFTAKQFQSFADRWEFVHHKSTPHYPQSNGKAESAVKSMKKIIRAAWNGRSLDEEKLCRAFLQYRNTPCCKDSLSPAQELYGQPVQDMLPAHCRSFVPQWQRTTEEAEQQATNTRDAVQRQYNSSAWSLPETQVGSKSNVAVQNPRTKLWDTYGIVTVLYKDKQR